MTVDAAAPLVDVKSAGIGDRDRERADCGAPAAGPPGHRPRSSWRARPSRPASRNTRSFQGGVNIAVAGGQGFGVAYLLDGAMHNDPATAAGLPLPFPDALQEFRLATSGLSAENGIHSGASVNAVTKSGTNRFHGNVFEFYRDRRFNATNGFAPVGPDGRRLDDGLHRNQFGGTLGGPIIANRLFFFGGYQRTQLRQQPNAKSGMCRRPRCWPATLPLRLGGVQQRAGDRAAGAVRGQPHRSGTLQSRRADARAIAPDHDRSVRRNQISVWRRGEHPGADGDQGRFSTNRRRFDLRPIHGDDNRPGHSGFRQYPLGDENPADDRHGQPVSGGRVRQYASVRQQHGQLASRAYNRTRALRLNRPAIGPEDLGIGPFYNYEPHRMAMNIIGGFTFGTNAGSSRPGRRHTR